MNPMQLKLPKQIKYLFFDLDHTLISSDSDVTWKQFLADKKIVGLKDRFWGRYYYIMYRFNKLNIKKFMRFQLRQFRGKTEQEMQALLQEHFEEKVKANIYQDSYALIKQLKDNNIEIALLTATNEAVAKPTSEHLGFDHLFATRLEKKEEKFTGDIIPPYCAGVNKIQFIQELLSEKGGTLQEVSYWGDSITDIPALEKVGFPVAANPAPGLKELAEKKGWPIVYFS